MDWKGCYRFYVHAAKIAPTGLGRQCCESAAGSAGNRLQGSLRCLQSA